MFALLVITAIAIGGINAQGWANAEPSPPTVNFIFIGSFPECVAEGARDVKSYTVVITESTDAQCSQQSVVTNFITLIANTANGGKTVVNLQGLASARYPDGADVITNGLVLATSDPLNGKYVFLRTRHLNRDYLKKCSSVLGYSYIPIKISELLICDGLTPGALIDPKGAYVALKNDKRCTLCNGSNFYGV